ncbi:hypothetical protein [Vibrio diabolicus]|uniref:hypothetical protein n=1 Tax=Vibrio diabolicus TaxID=50719 RepID=UPI0035A82F6C
MKVKSLLLCAALASPSVYALEFTTNATEEDYQMVGLQLTSYIAYSTRPEFCNSYPTPKINNAVKELRSLKESMNPWYETEYNQGVAVAKRILANTNPATNKAECDDLDISIGESHAKTMSKMKQLYLIR